MTPAWAYRARFLEFPRFTRGAPKLPGRNGPEIPSPVLVKAAGLRCAKAGRLMRTSEIPKAAMLQV